MNRPLAKPTLGTCLGLAEAIKAKEAIFWRKSKTSKPLSKLTGLALWRKFKSSAFLLLKFRYSEKAAKFDEVSQLI